MKNIFILILSFSNLFACGQVKVNSTILNENGKTITTRFNAPFGFERLKFTSNSFQQYLSNFELYPNGTAVKYYNGFPKINQNVAAAVLKIDIGKKDLQQCADAVMRLRAEYLFAQKLYKQIHFNFTNGFTVNYEKWAQGYRIKVNGNAVSWVKTKQIDFSYPTFKQYLEMVFTYAGTLSLSKEMETVPVDSIQIGDVFIKGGSPGHAVIVVDVAINKQTGKRIFMIAQSYMPAQSIHVLVNEQNSEISPWYQLNKDEKLITPEWTFDYNSLKRFKQ